MSLFSCSKSPQSTCKALHDLPLAGLLSDLRSYSPSLPSGLCSHLMGSGSSRTPGTSQLRASRLAAHSAQISLQAAGTFSGLCQMPVPFSGSSFLSARWELYLLHTS